MTTIVWKDGVLACDSQAGFGGAKYLCKAKLQLYPDFAYAVAGVLAEGLAAIEWFRADKEERSGPCPVSDDTTIVVMCRRTGKAWTLEAYGQLIEIEDKLFACGSGGDVALGALAMGATPKEAVHAACKWDEGTGFGVQVVYSEKAKAKEAK